MSAGEVKKKVPSIVIHTYPLCKQTDMPEEMQQESMEICVTAAEKFGDNYEHASRLIKENLDKKFGSPFHVIVGEAFSFSINYEEGTMIHMYTGGTISALIWRRGFS
ncbi:dynein light chain 4, axonemal-like [Belonocnema kinseyi]|uniref:dynein light chain 4, axonemal-like n=1 Tax=Belonocnema kinseyi TaxID=2817044 RepID=UPI00143CE58A|nr:dynein light chain 4, axonemal-like [Belonocnema kinseyi]